jgi:malate dehydrogenase (oxaloacetate-decarboxylating)(NADP+)
VPYAHDFEYQPTFLVAVKALQPTAIIGVSGQAGTFTQPVLEEMARINERPIVFALSNPTANAECTAEQAYVWTQRRAVFAGGSPFAPVTLDGTTFEPGQGNNAYIFPGIGLGTLACKSSRVNAAMFLAAAKVLAAEVTGADFKRGSLYPPLRRIREVSARIAATVAQMAYDQGLATIPQPDDLSGYIRSRMYEPVYPNYA